jgi:hypothetical protein
MAPGVYAALRGWPSPISVTGRMLGRGTPTLHITILTGRSAGCVAYQWRFVLVERGLGVAKGGWGGLRMGLLPAAVRAARGGKECMV